MQPNALLAWQNFIMQKVVVTTTPPAKSISESPEVMEFHLNWWTLFMIYLRTWGLPDDKDECERLRRQAGQYTLVDDKLFE
jgi:hypothetical protein